MAIRIPTRPYPQFSLKISNSNPSLLQKSPGLNPKPLDDKNTKSPTILPSLNSTNTHSISKIRKIKKSHTMKIDRSASSLQNSPTLNEIIPHKSNSIFSRSTQLKLTADPISTSPLFDDLYEEEKEIKSPIQNNEIADEDLSNSVFSLQAVDINSSQMSHWHKIPENIKKNETIEPLQIKKPQGLKIRVVKNNQSLYSSRSQENLLKDASCGRLSDINNAEIQLEDTNKVDSSTKKRKMKGHLSQVFHALEYLNLHPSLDMDLVICRKINLQRKPGLESKKTVIFDLDETLIHCVDHEIDESPDAIIPIKYHNGIITKTRIKIRPYAIECLRAVSKLCEVIIFTSFNQTHADAIIDFLDPKKEIIHHRLYRDSCVIINGLIIKDLRVLDNRNLEDIIIIDNSVYSFIYQLDNGIPIITWTNNEDDKELLNLASYIAKLAKSNDIRKINRKTFKLHRFYMDYLNEFAKDSPTKQKVN